jgi:hypothetical protein
MRGAKDKVTPSVWLDSAPFGDAEFGALRLL